MYSDNKGDFIRRLANGPYKQPERQKGLKNSYLNIFSATELILCTPVFVFYKSL